VPGVELTDDEGEGQESGASQRRDAAKKTAADGQRRAKCEDRAMSVLKTLGLHKPYPTDEDLERILAPWKGHDNKGRKKAAGPNHSSVESDSFGLVKPLHLPVPQLATITEKFPSTTNVLNLWLRSKPR